MATTPARFCKVAQGVENKERRGHSQ